MPSRLLNTTLSSLHSGVTEQFSENSFDSQVNDMVNCMPSISRGVLRRNPINLSNTMYTNSSTTKFTISPDDYVYTYDRGTGDEQYMIVITSTQLKIYNMNLNSDGIMTEETFTPSPVEGIAPVDNAIPTVGTYFEVPVGTKPKDVFDAVTIGDYTFIVNNTKIPTMLGNTTSSLLPKWEEEAFYWIKKTTAVVTGQDTTTATNPINILSGYTYNIKFTETVGGVPTNKDQTVTGTRDSSTSILSAAEIADSLATALGSSTQQRPITTGSFVYTSAVGISNYSTTDSAGDTASLGVHKYIDDATKLPSKLPPEMTDFIVKVTSGSSIKEDDYWLQYSVVNETWSEIKDPLARYRIDETTMPHVLYRFSNGQFGAGAYKELDSTNTALTSQSRWGIREVGDETTIPDPSFIGNPIQKVFFHKNRLGFLTKDSIVLSMTGEYGNFFAQTVKEVLDDDLIDIAVATTDVTVLRDVASTLGTILLFSDDSQFELKSTGGALTPISADVSVTSRYSFNNNMEVLPLSNKVYFSSVSGGYSQLFSYQLRDGGLQSTSATPLTIHIPSYLPNSIDKMVGHSVLGYNFITSGNGDNKLYVLTNTSIGTEDLQNAFHTWEFSDNIVSISIVNNDLYVVFDTAKVGRISLELPGDISTISYTDTTSSDDRTATFTQANYNSKIKFNQFYWRDANGKGTPRGRTQIRTLQYVISDSSFYETILENKGLDKLKPSNSYGDTWVDSDLWNDTLVWLDVIPNYRRYYYNDDKVTVMNNSKSLIATFNSDVNNPTKGFELSTVNIEMLFHQRSSRA